MPELFQFMKQKHQQNMIAVILKLQGSDLKTIVISILLSAVLILLFLGNYGSNFFLIKDSERHFTFLPQSPVIFHPPRTTTLIEESQSLAYKKYTRNLFLNSPFPYRTHFMNKLDINLDMSGYKRDIKALMTKWKNEKK